MSGTHLGIGGAGSTPHLAGVAVAGLHGVRLPDGTVGDVLIDDGTVDPVVAEAFPFARAADAHRMIAERRNVGKVVLVP